MPACWPRRWIRRSRCWSGCASCASAAPTWTNSSRSGSATWCGHRNSACPRPPTGCPTQASWRSSTSAPASWCRRNTTAGAKYCARNSAAPACVCSDASAGARARPAGCAPTSAARSCRCCRRWAWTRHIRSRSCSTSHSTSWSAWKAAMPLAARASTRSCAPPAPCRGSSRFPGRSAAGRMTSYSCPRCCRPSSANCSRA